jgi:hypothetical protein
VFEGPTSISSSSTSSWSSYNKGSTISELGIRLTLSIKPGEL